VTNQLLSDRYQIIQTLGSGGFGETFLAEDTQMPSRRRCVVKKLRPTENNPALTQLIQERFQREAAILETLSSGSRQIPQLYAYFYSEKDQQFYLVQEWIDGQTLSALLQSSGRLTEPAVRQILIDILPVFSYIHSRSIVHRDIKPDNVILRHSDKLPVLIDFGAVREAMGTVMNSQGQPTQSIVIGTPGYMPSEQSIGRPVYNSDLYSLGLTAIYLLTGQHPNDLPSDPSSAEILWRSQAPQVSSTFAQVLDKAISYHHRDRYQSATEFLAALTGSPVTIPTNLPANQPVTSPSNVATYVISPGNAAQPTESPASPTSAKNTLLVSGAIAATIVGGAMATALFLNNSNSKSSNVANNPVSTATVSATTKPVETVLSTPTSSSQPTASSSPRPKTFTATQPSITPSITSSPTPGLTKIAKLGQVFDPPSNIRQSPNGSAICSISEQKLINTYGSSGEWYYTDACGAMGVIHSSQIKFSADQSPTASKSPVSASPSNTPNSPSTNVMNPAIAVSTYYTSLNNRDYQTAWSKLPQELRDDRTVHPAGYNSFETWWNSIDSIEVNNIRVINQTAVSAEAIASTVYRMKNGRTQPFRIRYWMVWNATTQTWEIAKVRTK
jgi:serine/threonine protein kinase, bacterial